MNTQQLSIPEPCGVDWNTMTGDDRRRFCASCSKHVTHLSRMSETDAKSFLLDNPGACIQVEVIGDTILFEAAPKTTERRGWLRKAATVGALLSVVSPAYAAGHIDGNPGYLEQAIEWVKTLVGEGSGERVIPEVVETDPGETTVIPELQKQPPVNPPVRPVPMQILGGAPMPDPAYLERIQKERDAREKKVNPAR